MTALPNNSYLNFEICQRLKEGGDLANAFFIVHTHTHQYVEGITGANYYLTLYINEGFGYKTKKEAAALKNQIKKANKTKIAKNSRLGHYHNVIVLSGKDFYSRSNERYSDFYNYSCYTNKKS